MERSSEGGFTLLELMVATGALLVVLSGALFFFARSQTVYTNERAALDMVQDLRTVFDRFTNEIRMAGAGLPGYRGVVSGSANTLIVRGDFNDTYAIVTSTGANTGGVLTVGSTAGFAVGQTISLLSPKTRSSALAKVTAVNSLAGTLTISTSDFLAISSGAQVSDFGPGTIINVIERRVYSVKTAADDPNRGSITRTVSYESTQTAGAVIQPEEIVARNVLNAAGNVGLSFTYLDAAGNTLPLDSATGLVDPTKVAKVQINLQARTAQKDLLSKSYRTLNLSSLIQVRGQYIPAVGF